MIPRDRVRAALAHTQPEVTPCDYFATPEIHQALMRHFGLAREAATVPGKAGASVRSGTATRRPTSVQRAAGYCVSTAPSC